MVQLEFVRHVDGATKANSGFGVVLRQRYWDARVARKGTDLTCESRPMQGAVFPDFEVSRSELKRTMRFHELTTFIAFAVGCGVHVAFSIGILVTLSGLLKRSVQEPVSFSIGNVVLLALIVLAWGPCSHFLWRCYRAGLADIRCLHRQLSQVEAVRANLGSEAQERATTEQFPTASNVVRFDRRRT